MEYCYSDECPFADFYPDAQPEGQMTEQEYDAWIAWADEEFLAGRWVPTAWLVDEPNDPASDESEALRNQAREDEDAYQRKVEM